jgi:hypothetical protein
MSGPSDGNWYSGILSTATGVWQAFIVPTALGGWVVYQRLSGKKDDRRISEADRIAAYMNRIEARIVVQDAENKVLRAELVEERAGRFEERRDKMRGWGLARYWEQQCRDDRHAIYNVIQRGQVPDGWRLPDLPKFEDPE